jgi:hypothetical protein
VAEIHSAFVSQVAPIGFADLAEAFDELAGTEVSAGRAKLHIQQRTGTGFAGAAYYRGTLRTGSALIPTVKVEVVVSPWSSTRSEIGLRPLSNLGHFDSLRSNRFYNAARTVLAEVFDKLLSDLSTDDSADLVLAA